MEFKIVAKNPSMNRVFIIENVEKWIESASLSEGESNFVKGALSGDQSQVTLNRYDHYYFIQLLKERKTPADTQEGCRKAGAEIAAQCNKLKLTDVTISNLTTKLDAAVLYAEGMALACYQFLKYKSDAQTQLNTLAQISFTKEAVTVKEITRLSALTEAVFMARDLVNEPLNALGAQQLADRITEMNKDNGCKVTVLNKAKIEKEGMGGLLSVNRGSIDPPTFTITEYKPKKAINKNPIVLVGKGVVYDTGGLSLKPTPNSMDRMKSDMSGAAVVSCALYAIAKLELPLHIISLVPATDNRPGENAYVPGDVITMMSGITVEVLNTDAEGRMLLGDALHYAKRYNPELVLDFATLTGAASAAVGEHGIVCMGTANDDVKQSLRDSGNRQYERLVEYPLWDEYGEQIKSEVADIKNVGGASGGAITAGKFLERFTAYPWMHFDIAGVSFNTSKKGYIPSGGTGYGIRLLVDFLLNYAK